MWYAACVTCEPSIKAEGRCVQCESVDVIRILKQLARTNNAITAGDKERPEALPLDARHVSHSLSGAGLASVPSRS
jgi:hypothetical protein